MSTLDSPETPYNIENINWNVNLEKKIDELLSTAEPSSNDFIDLVWEYGILDRIAPKDKVQRELRKASGKAVWEGQQDDPELLLRILYSATSSVTAIEKRYTFTTSETGFLNGVFSAINLLHTKNVMSKLFPRDETSSEIQILSKIIEKSKQQLSSKVPNIEKHPYEIGKRIKLTNNDIQYEYEIEGYTDTGDIALKSPSYDSYQALYDISPNHTNSISPTQLN